MRDGDTGSGKPVVQILSRPNPNILGVSNQRIRQVTKVAGSFDKPLNVRDRIRNDDGDDLYMRFAGYVNQIGRGRQSDNTELRTVIGN